MAQSNMTRTVGLALEGGGYRGMYTAGVLDVWMEHGLTCDHMVGVSAGAAFGYNFKNRARSAAPFAITRPIVPISAMRV